MAENHRRTKFLRDGWSVDEYHGDKLWGTLTAKLMNQYRLPHAVCNVIFPVLTANDYQQKISKARDLPSYLMDKTTGNKRGADALEVRISMALLICWRI